MSRIIITALLLVAPGFSGEASGSWLYYTFVKYHKQNLADIFEHCYSGVCVGCMHERWPEPGPNPWEDDNHPNCEGLARKTGKPWFWAGFVAEPEWQSGQVWAGRDLVHESVQACSLGYEQYRCPGRRGAYVVGEQHSIFSIWTLFIDLCELGPPDSYAFPPYDLTWWGNYVRWLYYAKEVQWEYVNSAPWYVAWQAAAAYWGELELGGIPAGGEGDNPSLEAEEDFAKRLWIHALVNSQVFHGFENEWPILESNGIDPWNVYCVECTPTFVYWMNYFIDPVLQVPVSTEPTTWSSVKAKYR